VAVLLGTNSTNQKCPLVHKKDPKHVRQTLNPQSTIPSISNSSQTSLCPTVHRSSSFTTNEQIIVLSNNGTFNIVIQRKETLAKRETQILC
jgi:hypothetical protein